MRFEWNIARRYLFSKKSTNAINILTLVSMVGMAFGTAALILLLSIFNGFENVITSLYNTFDPELKVVPASGKYFKADGVLLDKVASIHDIISVSEVLEENALLEYGKQQYTAIIKGVDDSYLTVNRLDTVVYEGEFILKDGTRNFTVLGIGVARALGVNPSTDFGFVRVYMPKRGSKVSLTSPLNSIRMENLPASGVFSVEKEFDSKYAFVPLAIARKLLNYEDEVSALELGIIDPWAVSSVKKELQASLGDEYKVIDRAQMNPHLYKAMKTEWLGVYVILAFAMLLVSFNIIGSLTMLIIEKQKDIGILKAMGATAANIRNIFLLEGMMMAGIGGLVGGVIGILIAFAQKKFELVKLGGGGSFVIDAYPVDVRLSNLLLVGATVVLIAIFSAGLTAMRASRQEIKVTD